MNLRQMLDMASSILDYAPGIVAYEEEVRRFLNEFYLELFADRAWTFAQKDMLIDIKADRTNSVCSTTGPATITTATGGFFEEDMEGMIIQIEDSTAANNKEWRILARISGTEIRVETINGTPAALATDGSGTVKVRVKDRFIAMPKACIDILSFGIRSPENERQEFGYLTRWLDEHMSLDIDLVSRPTDWVMVEDLVVSPPVLKPTVAVGAGTVPSASTYDVCYTFIKQGLESAPSPVSATLSLTAVQALTVNNIQLTTNEYSQKRVYFRNNDSNRFYRALAADLASTVTTSGAMTIANPTSFLTSNAPLPEHEGRYKQIRLYPRQDQDYRATLRFSFRPQRLLDDADVPICPAEHHKYLVYRTCQELFIKHNNLPQSEIYRGRAEDELVKMMQRYLTTASSVWIKGVFRQSAVYLRPRPRLTHS
jgi:hypothetical protein